MKQPLKLARLPKAKTASRFTWERGAAALPAVMFVALMAMILIIPAMRPGTEKPAIRFQSGEVGYVPATLMLGEKGVLKVERVEGQSAIGLDPGQFERAENGNCTPDRPWFAAFSGRPEDDNGEPTCAALLGSYEKKSFLGLDRVWASTTIWDMYRPGEKLDRAGEPVEPANPLKAIKTNSRGLIESGYVASASGVTLTYADQPQRRCNWQLRRWAWLAQADQVDRGFEAVGPDCPGMGEEGSPVPDPSGPCFTAAQVGVTINCFDSFAVVSVPPTASGVAIRGRPALAGTNHILREGDVLSIDRGARVLQLLHRRGMSQRAPNGVRVRDLAYAGQTAQFDNEELRPGMISSINYRWDRRLRRLLDDSFKDALAIDPEHTLRGTILIMDGLTGEIAATASYPHSPEQLAKDRDTREDWLKQNFAFEALPPGSAAKVPFAAAILGAYPDLGGYTIDYAGAHPINYARFYNEDCPKGSKCIDLAEHGNASPPGDSLSKESSKVGIERFITNSSNYYALSLVREAWRKDPAQVPWKDRLRDLVCGWPRSEPGFDDSAAQCPIRLWADSNDPLRGRAAGGMVVPSPDSWIEPNNIFLGALGNGNYNWTAVQLAQAYARVITGRAVKPRLLQHKEGPAPITPSLLLDDTNWQKVMTGMSGVITTGTARNSGLGNAIAPGVFLYGKTGTPTLGWKLGGATQVGKVFVLAVVRTPNAQQPVRPSDICAVKMVVVNIQLRTGEENRGAVIAGELLRDPAIGTWLTAPCPAGAA